MGNLQEHHHISFLSAIESSKVRACNGEMLYPYASRSVVLKVVPTAPQGALGSHQVGATEYTGNRGALALIWGSQWRLRHITAAI